MKVEDKEPGLSNLKMNILEYNTFEVKKAIKNWSWNLKNASEMWNLSVTLVLELRRNLGNLNWNVKLKEIKVVEIKDDKTWSRRKVEIQ